MRADNPEFALDQPDVRSLWRDLRADSLPWALLLPFAAGFAILFCLDVFADPLQGAVPGILLYLLVPAVWLLRKKYYLLAVYLLVAECILAILLLTSWAQVGAVAILLPLPVGLAALLLGVINGAAIAAACSLFLLFAPPTFLPLAPLLRAITAVGSWGTIGLIWLALRPLETTLYWSWSSYHSSRHSLEQARDQRVQLKEVLEDLAEANLELTRLNRLAQGLRRTADEARNAKEQFVANVSHELRTPLNMIVGFCEMIMRAPQSYGHVPSALLADLEIVLRNGQHLSSLVDDVLDLSQVEAGQATLSKEDVALTDLAEAVVIAARPLFESKGLYLEAGIPADLRLFCDQTRIREVLLNLLTNAGRFTEQGGVRIRAWRDGPDIVVSVADTGPGISAEGQAKLFHPFQQLDGSIRRRYGGTGLGLSISKNFVELHGGKIWLESQEGIGTTFFVRLPVESPVTAQVATPHWLTPGWEFRQRTRPAALPNPAVRPRLVILETEQTLQRLLARHLDGVELAPASTPAEAIAELTRVPAQALLVNTPSVGQALEHPHVWDDLPYGTPAILCSVPGPTEVADTLGVSDYLVKPISQKALLRALDHANPHAKTVLVVDDEPDAQRLFRRMLISSENRYRVLRATDGVQALTILHEERPDVIFLDLVMPEMGGFQLLAEKEADPALRDIPVVLISALDPLGQPIVSNALAVTRSGGLSVSQLLHCIGILTDALATAGLSDDPARPGGLLGSPAC